MGLDQLYGVGPKFNLIKGETMDVRLVSYSRPSEEFGRLGIEDAQELIAFCARVSNPANQFNTETSERLIRYLIKNQHWSPLEMVSACLEITTTRDIARQILRHRSFSFQEFSQRYANPVEDLNFVIREARLQDSRNRQNSVELDLSDAEQRELSRLWEEKQQAVIATAREAYTWAVNNGIAKEQARAVLPEGNTESRLYMNGTLRSWIHYIELRAANGTQKEHMEIARACAQTISKVFPMAESLISS
jgi:thymidylate synthase (FAD)